MKINSLQISFIISLMGIFILLALLEFNQPLTKNISEINSKQLNQNIMISGQVISTKQFPDTNFQLINLQDKTGNITITIQKLIHITKNQTLIVTGKIIEYNGTLEIQAEKIILKD